VNAARGGPVRPGGRGILVLVVAAVVVGLDQVTKTWAEDHLGPARAPSGRHLVGTLWLKLTYNSGAAFGIGAGVTPVVVAVVIILVAALVVFGGRASRRAGGTTLTGIGLLLGGAVGNLTDRVFRHLGGQVVDFVDIARVGSRSWWPIFNLADAAIVVGAVVMVLSWSQGEPAPEGSDPTGARADA
jgi:signal peptidase II